MVSQALPLTLTCMTPHLTSQQAYEKRIIVTAYADKKMEAERGQVRGKTGIQTRTVSLQTVLNHYKLQDNYNIIKIPILAQVLSEILCHLVPTITLNDRQGRVHYLY